MQQLMGVGGEASGDMPEPEQAGAQSRRMLAGGILCLTALLVIGRALLPGPAVRHGAIGWLAPVASDMAPPDDNVGLEIRNAVVAYDRHDHPAIRARLTARSAIAYFRF